MVDTHRAVDVPLFLPFEAAEGEFLRVKPPPRQGLAHIVGHHTQHGGIENGI